MHTAQRNQERRRRPCPRIAALVDHELRNNARRFLIVSGSGLAACCRDLRGSRAEALVGTWSEMVQARDAPPARWPVAELLDVVEGGAAAGEIAAARLVASLLDFQVDLDRLATLAWLAQDPLSRDAAVLTDA